MRNRKHLRFKVIILNRKVHGVKNKRNKNSRNVYIYYDVDVSSIMYYYNTKSTKQKYITFFKTKKNRNNDLWDLREIIENITI